jgi:hypothetical protein
MQECIALRMKQMGCSPALPSHPWCRVLSKAPSWGDLKSKQHALDRLPHHLCPPVSYITIDFTPASFSIQHPQNKLSVYDQSQHSVCLQVLKVACVSFPPPSPHSFCLFLSQPTTTLSGKMTLPWTPWWQRTTPRVVVQTCNALQTFNNQIKRYQWNPEGNICGQMRLLFLSCQPFSPLISVIAALVLYS